MKGRQVTSTLLGDTYLIRSSHADALIGRGGEEGKILMLIQSQNPVWESDIPKTVVGRLKRAIADMGYGEGEVTLSIMEAKQKRLGTSHEPIALVRYEDLMLVIEVQTQGHALVYVCKLEFRRKCPNGGLVGRTLWQRLERKFKEIQNGHSVLSEETPPPPAVPQPPSEKFHPHTFSKSHKNIQSVMAYMRERYGLGPHPIALFKDVLRETIDGVQAPGRIITTLVAKSWLTDNGGGTFTIVTVENEPKDSLPIPRSARAEMQTAPANDPLAMRLQALTDTLKGEGKKRAEITRDEETLKKLEAERLLLDTRITTLDQAIKKKKRELMSPDKLSELDKVLKSLGIELPAEAS